MQNSGYPADWIESLKSKNNIVDIVSKYVHVERKGRTFWACCPFHHEKTPSFAINEYEQYYHCFGCSESGDVIRFVEKIESCDFMEAVKILAENVGMEIPKWTGDEDLLNKKKVRDRLYLLLNDAAAYYQKNLLLPTSKIAQDYIKKRNLTNVELQNFQIGYSKDWTDVISFLKSKNYSLEEMKEAGIIEFKNERPYDVFGGRLMFPIVNTYGDCVGFSARQLEKSDFAKYKNSSQTLVFDKSKIVYGINLIKKLKLEKHLDYIVIVEGQMDVIAMHKAGFVNAVACMGTALTQFHAKEIKRFCDNVIVCFDGDEAGQKATLRSLDILNESGLNVTVASLPNGKDPDEIIDEFGKDFLDNILKNSLPIIDYKLKITRAKFDLSKANEKAEYLKECFSIIREIDTRSAQDVYLEIVKKESNLPIDVLRRDISSAPIVPSEKNVDEAGVLISREDGNIKAIKFILASILHKKEYAGFSPNIEKFFFNSTLKKLYLFLKERKENKIEWTISMLFDEFDVESEPVIKELIDYDFEGHVDFKKYYEESLWQLFESSYKDEQSRLAESFKLCGNISERRQIALDLNRIMKLLKNKIMEE